jgi:hypothetical protein
MQTYEVQVSNFFDAESAEDAVAQMVAWLIDNAHKAGYRVIHQPEESSFMDAEDVLGNYGRES